MTLVELMVVLGIIGLIVGMSVPGFVQYARQARLKSSTRQLLRLVSLARSVAISSHEDCAVVYDPDERVVTVAQAASGGLLEARLRLPSMVTLEFDVGGEPADEPQIVFRPTGSLSGRTVTLTLSDRDKRQTIVVTGATGAVTTQ